MPDEKCARCGRVLGPNPPAVSLMHPTWTEPELQVLCRGCWERVRAVILNSKLRIVKPDK